MMKNPILESFRYSVNYWYIPLVLGVLFVLVGIWVSATPITAYLTLAILFASTFFVAGILEIVYAISNRKTLDHWVWVLISGIIGLVLGVLLISNPVISMVVLPFYVGFGVLFYSIIGIGRAIELRKHSINGWKYLMFTGIVGLILSFIMIWNPVFGGLTIVFYTAFTFMILGVLNVFLAFKMKELNKQLMQK